MAKPPYLKVSDFLGLLSQELEDLHGLNCALAAEDKDNLRLLDQRCSCCNAPLSWDRLLCKIIDLRDNLSGIDVYKSDLNTNIMDCSCGHSMEIENWLMRGESELAEQRRKIYDSCMNKIKTSSALPQARRVQLLRFIFRASIVDVLYGEHITF